MSSDTPLALFCGDFTFEQDSLTKYLICGVCRMVMRNPMRLHSCGHTFCDKCVLTTACSECLQPFEAKQPDLTAASLVADSMVRCLARGCPFRGTFQTYLSTHKNTCKMKNFNGLEDWMDKVKESLGEATARNKALPTVNCDVIEVEETVRPLPDPSVILENVTNPNNNFSDLQSLVVESRAPRKIDFDSLYHINPQNQARVAEQMRELKQRPGARRCQYGRNCKLMLEQGGCPYIHPEKNPRRQYELEKWANIKVVRPPNHFSEIVDEINKRDREDTHNFMNQFFPVQKIPERKREQEVQVVPSGRKGREKEKEKEKGVIQL